MDVIVKIHFTGLCAFVPEKYLDAADNEATALLVNARQSAHGPHYSLFLADPKRYVDTGNRPTSTIEPEPTKLLKLCLLGGETLKLAGFTASGTRVDPSPNSLRLATGIRRADEICPNGGNAKDISWVAKNQGLLRLDLLASTNVADLLAVRMRMTSGELMSGGDFRRVDNHVVRWQFGPGPSTPLTEDIIWSVTLSSGETIVKVVLESAPFDGASPQKNIVLAPDGNNLEAFIANLPAASLLGLERKPFEPDHHYREFYRLCRGTPPSHIPVPDLFDFCPPVADTTNPKCPPTLFAPVALQSMRTDNLTYDDLHSLDAHSAQGMKGDGH